MADYELKMTIGFDQQKFNRLVALGSASDLLDESKLDALIDQCIVINPDEDVLDAEDLI